MGPGRGCPPAEETRAAPRLCVGLGCPIFWVPSLHTLVSQQTREVAWAGERPGLGARPVLGLLPLLLSLGWLESPAELGQAVPTLRARSRTHPEARPSRHLPLTPLRRGSPRVPWSHHDGILLWRGRFPWQLPSSAPVNTFHSQWGSAAGGWGTAGCHPAPVAPTPHERTSDTATGPCVPLPASRLGPWLQRCPQPSPCRWDASGAGGMAGGRKGHMWVSTKPTSKSFGLRGPGVTGDSAAGGQRERMGTGMWMGTRVGDSSASPTEGSGCGAGGNGELRMRGAGGMWMDGTPTSPP